MFGLFLLLGFTHSLYPAATQDRHLTPGCHTEIIHFHPRAGYAAQKVSFQQFKKGVVLFFQTSVIGQIRLYNTWKWPWPKTEADPKPAYLPDHRKTLQTACRQPNSSPFTQGQAWTTPLPTPPNKNQLNSLLHIISSGLWSYLLSENSRMYRPTLLTMLHQHVTLLTDYYANSNHLC